MISSEDLELLQKQIPNMSERDRQRHLTLLTQYKKEITKTKAEANFLDFIRHVYPDYIVGEHHARLAKLFEEIANGVRKRVIVNIAPRHGKSELISYLAPAWFLGKHPAKKVIMASHTADLAVNFGRRVRNLVGSEQYKDIFPDISLQADSKSASRWGTNFNGEYFAIGVGGALAGRGADLFIIDDPHSEQDAKLGKGDVFLPAWEWFQSGPLQRLMPGGAIVVVMTRWSKLDLTGQIINQMAKNDDVDDWEVVEFPAIESDWVAMKDATNKVKVEFAEVDNDKRILMGAALIPDKPIYRRDLNDEEYYVYFSKATVRKCMEMFFSYGNQNNATLEHEHPLRGLSVVESWIVEDKDKDKTAISFSL